MCGELGRGLPVAIGSTPGVQGVEETLQQLAAGEDRLRRQFSVAQKGQKVLHGRDEMVLQALADGAPGVWLTEQAKRALERK